jgi:hypothetical protein
MIFEGENAFNLRGHGIVFVAVTGRWYTKRFIEDMESFCSELRTWIVFPAVELSELDFAGLWYF